MSALPLSAAPEAEAQRLAARLREATTEDLLALARLLVSKPENQLFGQTEFEVRDLVHRIGAKAYEIHRAEKKTATTTPASSAPPASKPPDSRTIGRKRR